MRALIDGDVVLYQIGFACQKKYWLVGADEVRCDSRQELMILCRDQDLEVVECLHVDPIENALHSVKVMLDRIQAEAGCSEREIYLTGKGNYREEIYPAYKANRKDTPKPVLYHEIKDYMISVHGALVVDGQEADDALGINQMDCVVDTFCGKDVELTVICTIDKDLDTVPGYHYNWNKPDKGVYSVSPHAAQHWFYCQLLMGDKVDNICGLRGIGPKKAEAILDNLNTIKDYQQAVWNAYRDHRDYTDIQEEELREIIETNANLLRIRTEDKQPLWTMTTIGSD